MSPSTCKILFVGESAYKIHVHFKGFASYETAYLGDNLDPFIQPVQKYGVEVNFMRNHEVASRFPLSREELAVYDAIVISDAPSDSFLLHPQTLAGERLPNRFKLINEYVRGGGGLVMIGGWMAFSGFHAKARYPMTPLAEILPVKMCLHDDRMEIPEGAVPEVRQPQHPILKGVPVDWPFFLGYNKTFFDRGEMLMTINTDPLLVVHAVGAGRVAVFTSDVMPHWGPKEFVGWEYYGLFWSQLFKWAASGL